VALVINRCDKQVADEFVDTSDPDIRDRVRSGSGYQSDDVPFSCCDRAARRPCITQFIHDNKKHFNYDYQVRAASSALSSVQFNSSICVSSSIIADNIAMTALLFSSCVLTTEWVTSVTPSCDLRRPRRLQIADGRRKSQRGRRSIAVLRSHRNTDRDGLQCCVFALYAKCESSDCTKTLQRVYCDCTATLGDQLRPRSQYGRSLSQLARFVVAVRTA